MNRCLTVVEAREVEEFEVQDLVVPLLAEDLSWVDLRLEQREMQSLWSRTELLLREGLLAASWGKCCMRWVRVQEQEMCRQTQT